MLHENKNNACDISPEVRLIMEKVLADSAKNRNSPLNIGIMLTYLIHGNQNNIRLFWNEFIKRNKNNCYLIFYNKSKKISF